MKKIRVIQLGTAHPHASGIFQSIKKLPNIYEVVGVCEPNDDEKSNLDSELYRGIDIYNVADIVENRNIDGVIVETEEKDLTKYAQMMVDAGFNVHVDKPGGEDFREYEALVNTAKSKNLVFHTGYMYRFNPAVIKAIELVKSGKLGKIFSVDAKMCIRLNEVEINKLKRFSGGMMTFLGCHMLDIVLSLLGVPDKVIPKCFATHTYDTDALDYGMAILEYSNGIATVCSSAADINGFFRRQIVINGTLGSIEIKPMEVFDMNDTDYLTTNMNISYESCASAPCLDCSEKLTFPRYKRYDDMMIDFAEIVNGAHENFYSYEHEINLRKIISQAGQLK